ncbi:MAG: helix-turn-helix transcriptional regulator [Planctomycetes bacterium]|nr:helix-turn-helix transcriptional regulator [Planctomycetota bacterium]
MNNSKKSYAREFAYRIKQLRIQKFGDQRGAQSAAALALSISPAEWRGYEMGVLPGADRLAHICRTFECDANWLLGVSSSTDTLSSSQEEFVKLLATTQELIHGIDEIHTSYLSVMLDALKDPAIAQQQCYKLYKIARGLKDLHKQVNDDKATPSGG